MSIPILSHRSWHDACFSNPRNIPIGFFFERYEFKAWTSRLSVSDSSQCQIQFSLVAHDTMLASGDRKIFRSIFSLKSTRLKHNRVGFWCQIVRNVNFNFLLSLMTRCLLQGSPKNISIEFLFEQYEFKAWTSRFSVSDSSQCQFQFSLVAHDTTLTSGNHRKTFRSNFSLNSTSLKHNRVGFWCRIVRNVNIIFLLDKSWAHANKDRQLKEFTVHSEAVLVVHPFDTAVVSRGSAKHRLLPVTGVHCSDLTDAKTAVPKVEHAQDTALRWWLIFHKSYTRSFDPLKSSVTCRK